MCETGMLTHPTAAHLAECETCRRAIVAVVEQLRERLAISEAARVAAEERLSSQQTIMDTLNRSRETLTRRIIAAEERARVLLTAVRAHHAAISRLDDHVERTDCDGDAECDHPSHEEESEARAAVDVLLRAYPAPAATAKAPA